MRNILSGLLIIVLTLTMGLAVYAQDTTAQGGDLMCDSDLLLNLYVANRFFGFNQFHDELTARGSGSELDFNRFNQGQFGPLFQGFSDMQGVAGEVGDTSTTGDTSDQTPQPGQEQTSFGFNFTEEQRTNILDILALDDATFQTEFRNRLGAGAETSTNLNAAAVADEAQECAQLRNALNRFWTAVTIEDFSTGMVMGMADQGQVSGTGETETGAQGEVGEVAVSLIDGQIDMPTSVAAGTVTFNITNNGTHEHSFEIEGNGVEEELEPHLQPGESGTLTVDLAPGTYTVYCPVNNHRAEGMELQLTVT